MWFLEKLKRLKICNKSIWFNIPKKITFQTFVTSVLHHTELYHSEFTMYRIQRQRKEVQKSTMEHIVGTLFSADIYLDSL